MKAIGELAPTLFADRQARSGLMPPWANGKAAKEYRAAMGNKPVGGIFSVGVEEAYRWKDSVQSEAEIRIWFADGVANGLRPWFTKFAGVLRDRALAAASSRTSTAGITAPSGTCGTRRRSPGSAWSTRSRPPGSTAARRRGRRSRTTLLGWYQALVEARIPFEMVHDRLLDEAHLARLKTLILPNIAALSDEQCRQLRAFVERGGGLVATYETSLCDEWGAGGKDFGLADLFGVSFRGKRRGADAERLPAARGRSPHRPPAPAARRPGRRTAPGSSTGPQLLADIRNTGPEWMPLTLRTNSGSGIN